MPPRSTTARASCLICAVALALLAPSAAGATPALSSLPGFLALDVSAAASCAGPGECVAVDVSLAPANPSDVILFDLQLAWDPTFWALDSIVDTAVSIQVVQRDDASGFIDDLFGDVGLGAPIAAGDPLFRLVFEVVGNTQPLRTVLEIGDLSGFDPFFDRPVLVADASFDVLQPTPNAQIVVPEPSTGLLLALGLAGVSLGRGRREGR